MLGAPSEVVALYLGRWFAQPALTVAGLLMLALVPIGLAWARLDHRLVHGELTAIKPTKFAASLGVYLLTVSWMLGYVRPERLGSPLVFASTWGLLIGASVELFCIVLQAARGRASHFNTATSLDAAIAGTMLFVAILFVGTLLPLAWEVARRPRPDAAMLMIVAIVAGLVATFVLGALSGTGMARNALGAAPRPDVILPLIGWRVTGGPARIAHFLGVHALQAFPLIAAAALLLRGRAAPLLFAVAATGYIVVTLTLLWWSTTWRRPPPSCRPKASSKPILSATCPMAAAIVGASSATTKGCWWSCISPPGERSRCAW